MVRESRLQAPTYHAQNLLAAIQRPCRLFPEPLRLQIIDALFDVISPPAADKDGPPIVLLARCQLADDSCHIPGLIHGQSRRLPRRLHMAQHLGVGRPGTNHVDADIESGRRVQAQGAHNAQHAMLGSRIGKEPRRLLEAGNRGQQNDGPGASASLCWSLRPQVCQCDPGKVQRALQVDVENIRQRRWNLVAQG